MTSRVSNPVYIRNSVLVDILFYLCVRGVGMCSVPKLFFLPIIANQLGTRCFLGARILARPGTQCNAGCTPLLSKLFLQLMTQRLDFLLLLRL